MMDALTTLYVALMLASGVVCVCGNVLLLLTFVLNRDLRSDTLALMLSSSLSDLALGMSIIPFAVYNCLAAPACCPSDGALCQGSGFLFLLLQTVSVHSLAWTGVDRFTEICFALSYSNMWTVARRRGVLVLVWVFGLVCATLPLLGFGSYTYSESRFLCCPSFSPAHRDFVLLWTLLGIAAPILAMCSLYGYIVYVARKQARRGTFMCNELHCYYVPANNYLRSSIVMVATSVCLLVCWLPYISVCLYETLSEGLSPPVSTALSAWLVVSGAAMNPWITCLTQTYRDALRHTIGRVTQTCQSSSPPSQPRTQSFTPHLDTANRISSTTTTTVTTLPPPSPETPITPTHS